MANLANVAATLHEHLCKHDNHGYTWDARWGDGKGYCYVTVEGRQYALAKGDRDCSSSVIDAWSRALEGTKYEGALKGATYTGNMKKVFLNSGLFSWKPMSFIAQRGDIYLNEQNHTAMCQSPNPDKLSEFCINEFGGVYGGKTGDQTGGESRIANYYDYPWDGILHYEGGKNVAQTSTSTKTEKSKTTTSSSSSSLPRPRYRGYTKEHQWLDWMKDLKEESGGSDDYCGVPGCWLYDMEFDLPAGSWFQLTLKNGKVLPKNQQNTAHKEPIIGVTVYYNTPKPKSTGYYAAYYRAHPVSKSWLKWEIDDEDGGAGDDATPIDMFQLTLKKCD